MCNGIILLNWNPRAITERGEQVGILAASSAEVGSSLLNIFLLHFMLILIVRSFFFFLFMLLVRFFHNISYQINKLMITQKIRFYDTELGYLLCIGQLLLVTTLYILTPVCMWHTRIMRFLGPDTRVDSNTDWVVNTAISHLARETIYPGEWLHCTASN